METKLRIIELCIQGIGILFTVATVYISIRQFSKGIKTSILHSKMETMLEQTSELPYLVAEFCSHATNVFAVFYVGEDKLNDIMKQEFKESRKKQDELLIKITNMIFAYGSRDAIKILNEFTNIIKSNNGTQVITYYILPLLLSQVKLDVTGETVDPVIFINGLMPQFKSHKENAKIFINEEIDKLKLVNLKKYLNNKES